MKGLIIHVFGFEGYAARIPAAGLGQCSRKPAVDNKEMKERDWVQSSLKYQNAQKAEFGPRAIGG